MSNIKERTRELLAALNMGHEEFQDRCGLGGGFVSRISTMTRKASFDKIKAAFPQVNINWLLTGKGEMFGEEPKSDNSSIGARLHQFALYLGMNDRQFERAASLSNGYLNKASNTVTPKTRLLLTNKFPTLNIEWLLTGSGNMIAQQQTMPTTSPKDRLRYYIGELGIGESRFLAHCGISAKRVDALSILSDELMASIKVAYPDLNPDWVLTGNGSMCQRGVIHSTAVPFVTKNTRKQYAMRHSDNAFIEALPPLSFDDGQIAFEVTESFCDYKAGDIVVCKETPKGALLAYGNGKDCVIVMPDDIVMGRVEQWDMQDLLLTIYNNNNQKIDLSKVGKTFIIEWVIRKRV